MAVDRPSGFGTLLRRHRLRLRLTQEEIAERAGLSVRGISDLERGARQLPHRDTARRLADALGLTGSERVAFEAGARGRPVPSEAPEVASVDTVGPELGNEQPTLEIVARPNRGGHTSPVEATPVYARPETGMPSSRLAAPPARERAWIWRTSRFAGGVLVLILVAAGLYLHGSRFAARTASTASSQFAPWGWRAAAVNRLSAPSAVAVDKHGALFVADTGNNRIEKLSPDGTLLATWGGRGASPGRFDTPESVVVDSRGNVYVADTGNLRVQELSPAGKPIAVWGPQLGYYSIQPVGLAVDSRDNVYMLDTSSNCVTRLIREGNLGIFCPGYAGLFDKVAALAVDIDGNIYVSSAQNGVVAQVSPSPQYTYSGTVLQQWRIPAPVGGRPPNPIGLATDRRGDLYVVDAANNRIEKLSPTGKALAIWGRSGSQPGQFLGPLSATTDARGDVYVADAGNNRVQELSPAGNPRAVWSALRPLALHLDEPSGLAADRRGNVYVSTGIFNSHVLKFSPKGLLLADWGPRTFGTARPYTLAALAVDDGGNVYATDVVNSQIDKVSPFGRLLNRFGSWDAYLARVGTFNQPLGVAVDHQGRIYVADTTNNRIQELSSKGDFLAQFGFRERTFDAPHDVAVDTHGYLYVVDTGGHRIVKLSPEGAIVAQWGTQGSGPGQFMNPAGVAVGPHDNVYVVDSDTDRVSEFSSAGELLAQWGGSGTGVGQFSFPSDVAVDGAGNVYVADRSNDRIERLPAIR